MAQVKNDTIEKRVHLTLTGFGYSLALAVKMHTTLYQFVCNAKVCHVTRQPPLTATTKLSVFPCLATLHKWMTM